MESPCAAIDSMFVVAASGWTTSAVSGSQTATTPRPSMYSTVAISWPSTTEATAGFSTQVGPAQSWSTDHCAPPSIRQFQ